MDTTMLGYDDLIKFDEKIIDRSEKPNNFIAFVMDHSGSMSDIAEASRINFNEQLQQIKEDSAKNNNYVTLITFNGNVREVFTNKDINEISELKSYPVGGSTALYDAIVLAIVRVESYMTEEGNNAALIVIITDGYENASVEHCGEAGRLRVKARIEELQKSDKWTFVFMGAEQNVLDTAVEGLGIYAGNTMSFSATSDGTRFSSERYMKSYARMSESRTFNSSSTNFFAEDKEDDN